MKIKVGKFKIDPVFLAAAGGLGFIGYKAYSGVKNAPLPVPFGNTPLPNTSSDWGGLDQSQVITDVAVAANVNPTQVQITGIRRVTTSDTSLGCPQSGQSYAQIPQAVIEVTCQITTTWTLWRWAVNEKGGSPRVCKIG